MKTQLAAVALAGVCLASFGAGAAPVTFTGSSTGPGGVPVAASATFGISGNTLTITLQNTSGSNAGQDVPGSTITGLFFDLTGNPLLTPVSAQVASGSSIVGAPCSVVTCVGVTNVGGEFGYQATSLTGGADRGIASSGYLTTGLPGDLGNFNGVNLDDPASLDGINFGLISAAAGFNPNGGLEKVPLIQDEVVFTLTGVSGLGNVDISHVSFQYGTSLSELNVPGTPGRTVPEPDTLALVGLALAGVGALGRKKKS